MSLANGDSAGFFAAAAEGRLVMQACGACGAVQFPPRHHCAACWETDLIWKECSGKGRVETLTVVRRAPLPRFADKVPYVVASIILEEGPRMITNVIGDDALDTAIGDAVAVAFAPGPEGETLPVFRRA